MTQCAWTVRLALMALLLAACGDGAGSAPGNAPGDAPGDATGDAAGDGAVAPADAADGWQECSNDRGFVASYPQGWVTNDGSVMAACSLFDPEAFTVPEESEVPEDIAVVIHVEDVPWSQIAGSEYFLRILSRDDVTVAGRSGIRRLVEHTGEGYYERGVQSYEYIVDWGNGLTLVASSHNVGDPAFEVKRRMLDAMMERLRTD